MKIPFTLVEEALVNDEMVGWCINCGEQAQNIEPDARMYECEVCGDESVYGAQELLLMDMVDCDSSEADGSEAAGWS